MRREELYLRDIVEAADSVAAFLSRVRREEFLQDDLLRSAVLQKLWSSDAPLLWESVLAVLKAEFGA